MRKKDAALLITLSIVMTGTFLVISNLESKSKGQSKAWEELPATWEESPPQDLGTPESPGYAWDAAASSNLTNIMDISELANYPVYYFSVPGDAEKYSEGIARELLGSDYGNAEVSSERMQGEIFPGWGNITNYQLSNERPTKLAVSLYHVSYTDSRQAENLDNGEEADLAGLTNRYLKKFRWGLWDGAGSCSILEEKDGTVEVSTYLSGLSADKYTTTTQIRHEDGYFYDVAKRKMIFSYSGGRLSGLEFVFSGTLNRKEELQVSYNSIQEIMDTIKTSVEREVTMVNAHADNPTYTLFEPKSAEYCYIIGIHPENPGYKASPWLVVSGPESVYWFGDKKWTKNKDTHIGINLATGEVWDLMELKSLF